MVHQVVVSHKNILKQQSSQKTVPSDKHNLLRKSLKEVRCRFSLMMLLNLYADDSQIYGSCRPSAYPELQSRIPMCIDHVAQWMHSNRLQLTAAKTEILWSATSHWLHQLPQASLRVGIDFMTPATAVRDLGILLDSDMSMSSYVRKTVSTCFVELRQLHSIRHQCPDPWFSTVDATCHQSSGLQYRDTGWYSSTSPLVASVSDECSCLTNLLVIEVWSHHSAPPSTSLAEGKGTDW